MNAEVATDPRELVAGVRELFTLPEMYMRVKEAIEDEESSVGDVAELIATDPVITARLLRFANSAFFGLSRQVDSVSRAVTVLGTQLAHDVVLATSVVDSCAGVADAVDLRAFWADSAYCGLLARLLAQRCNVLDSERIFLEGLLRDLGHLVMYQQIPEEMRAAREQARSSGRQLYLVEQELLGCHYGEVGQELMAAWQLPASFGEVARYHVDPGSSANCPLEAAMVHIAHHVALGSAADGDLVVEELPISAAAWSTTNLTAEMIGPVKEEADSALAETQALFVDAA